MGPVQSVSVDLTVLTVGGSEARLGADDRSARGYSLRGRTLHRSGKRGFTSFDGLIGFLFVDFCARPEESLHEIRSRKVGFCGRIL